MLDAAADPLDVIIIRRIQPDEARALAIGARDEHALGHERVRVRVEPGAVCEALNFEHTTGLGRREAAVVGPLSLPVCDLVGKEPVLLDRGAH